MIIAFDLDGTLSDPIEGVANSANHALERLGFPPKDREEIRKFIGPPLQEIFQNLLGTEDKE